MFLSKHGEHCTEERCNTANFLVELYREEIGFPMIITVKPLTSVTFSGDRALILQQMRPRRLFLRHVLKNHQEHGDPT